VLKDARQRLDSANAQVRRLALSLNVPQPIAELIPDDAVSDPRYAVYRPYFEARIEAAFAQRVVSAAENVYGAVALKSY
jgi:hypothetical protein